MEAHLTNCDYERFWKCRISNAVDETDGDMLWNGSEQDGNVRGECEVDFMFC
jgi:hypothetical protein